MRWNPLFPSWRSTTFPRMAWMIWSRRQMSLRILPGNWRISRWCIRHLKNILQINILQKKKFWTFSAMWWTNRECWRTVWSRWMGLPDLRRFRTRCWGKCCIIVRRWWLLSRWIRGKILTWWKTSISCLRWVSRWWRLLWRLQGRKRCWSKSRSVCTRSRSGVLEMRRHLHFWRRNCSVTVAGLTGKSSQMCGFMQRQIPGWK